MLQNAVWERFSQTASAVLSVFESNPLTDTDVSGSDAVGVAANGYGTKYLTSSKLTHLEVHDAAFRRHMLLQTRFLLQFLQLPNSSGQTAQRLVAVTGTQLQAVRELEERVAKCLKGTPPSAAEFAAAVENAIVRERMWLTWKINQCKVGRRASQTDCCACFHRDGTTTGGSAGADRRSGARRTSPSRLCRRRPRRWRPQAVEAGPGAGLSAAGLQSTR